VEQTLNSALNAARARTHPAIPPRPQCSHDLYRGVRKIGDQVLWYSDGGCDRPGEPRLRNAAAAGWLADHHDFNFALPVPGPGQTNQEGELYAVLFSFTWS
jgi:hypothetical protein